MDKYASNSNQSVIVIKNHHKKGNTAMRLNLNKYQQHKVFLIFCFMSETYGFLRLRSGSSHREK